MESTGTGIKALALAGFALSFGDPLGAAEEPDAPRALVKEDLLQATEERGVEEVWRVLQGVWSIEDGALRGECDASESAAISRRSQLKGNDFLLELRFRLMEPARALQVVFHADRAQDERTGGLFSVVALDGATKILRHRNQAVPGDQTRAVAEVFHRRELGEWYDLEIRCVDGEVTVRTDGEEFLRASHPDFSLDAGSTRLRAVRGAVEIGELVLSTPEKGG